MVDSDKDFFKGREIEAEEERRRKGTEQRGGVRFSYYLFSVVIMMAMMMVVCRTNCGNMRRHRIAAQNAIVLRPLMYKTGAID